MTNPQATIRTNIKHDRGNVLIMVVVLLVLLALMATGFITMTRVDRSTTVQNSVNTQIDMLVDGAVEMAIAPMVDDLFGDSGAFREPSAGTVLAGLDRASYDPAYKPWTFPFNNDTSWLGSRYPAQFNQVVGEYSADRLYDVGDWTKSGGNYYIRLSAVEDTNNDGMIGPGDSSPPPSVGEWQASIHTEASSGDFPVWPAIAKPSDAPFNNPINVPGGVQTTLTRTMLEPTTYTLVSGAIRPALRGYDVTSDSMQYFIAADADGDGIADSLLQKLPMSPINGVTYYWAVRIIDANSAVNVSTARAWESTIPTPTGLGNFFPSNIDLRYVLRSNNPNQELQNLVDWRWNGGTNVANTVPGVFGENAADNSVDYSGSYSFTSVTDAEWSQLGRRLENPGYRLATTRFRTLGLADQFSLGTYFVLPDADVKVAADESNIERALQYSLPTPADGFAHDSQSPYAVGDVGTWFEDNFWAARANTAEPASVRAYLTTLNPVSTSAGSWLIPGDVPADAVSLASQPAVKVNINTALFNDLYRAYYRVMANGNATSTQVVPHDPATPTTYVENPIFRHNLFRESTGPNPDVVMQLRAAIAAANAVALRSPLDPTIEGHQINVSGYTVRVFGLKKQPYISEVVIWKNANGIDTDDYAAIELFNPHNEMVWGRNTAGNTGDTWRLIAIDRATMAITDIPLPSMPDNIPPLSRLVIHDSANQPADIAVNSTLTPIDVPGLSQAILGKEVVLIRESNLPSTGDYGDWAPIDQVSLKGLTTADPVTTPSLTHYVRNDTPGKVSDSGVDLTDGVTWAAVISTTPMATPVGNNATLGDPNIAFTVNRGIDDFLPLQLNATDWPSAPTTSSFPRDLFARAGDILQVPFIGSYAIRASGGALAEMNGVAVDMNLAHDQDAGNNGIEQVGRFCPLSADDWTLASGPDYYNWASDIFDYIGVETPSDDWLPYAYGTNTSLSNSVRNKQGSGIGNDVSERRVGVQGLININTAPYEVLRTVPFWDAPAVNDAIAEAIVRYRNVHGPFKSLFDLNKVDYGGVIFRTAAGQMAADADEADGDFSPAGAGNVDGITGDFEERYLMINRISNLVTLRSDSFYVYVSVQGWRKAGTSEPELVAERRRAYYIDRSGTYLEKSVTRTQLPTQ